MRVLGLSGHFHDAAAALVVDGALVAAAQEERFSRRKHDPSTPLRAAAFCLAHAGLRAEDLDAVVWFEKPLLKLERVLLTSLATWPRGATSFRRAAVSMFGDRIWVRNELTRRLGVRPERVQFAAHHASHAAGAFGCSPFSEAAVLCVDGVGEWATTSLWRGRPGALEPLGELHFPHSLGLLYSVFTAFLGFEVNEGEYKVMGLAAHGQPTRRAEVDRLLQPTADGGFALDMRYFQFDRHPETAWSPAFEALFGPPRRPGAPVEPVHADIAASIQQRTEEALLDLARAAHARTGARHLCLAGGVALNAVAVGRLIAEGPFADVFVLPPAGDAGSAIGAALLGAGLPAVGLPTVALGEGIDIDAARTFFKDGGVPFQDCGEDGIAAAVAERLARGEVVGWMQGRFEMGPRALGQRSILAAATDPAMKDRLNAKVKFRESFRPFAPSVLVGHSPALFALPAAGAHTRRFMTSTVAARGGLAGSPIPAALHVDGTARVQEVDPAVLPLYGALLAEVGARTGQPCVVNTSFNLAGEPIVASPADGWATFLRSGIDALAVGPLLITREPAA